MKKTSVVIMLVVLCAANTVAFDLMGPPTAQLKQGQFSVGAEYLWSETDVDVDNIVVGGISLGSVTLDNFESNKVYGNLGYGITDDWEAFLRLGAVNSEDSDFEFAIGGGTKINLSESEDGKVKWGVLAQLSWVSLDLDDESGLIGATPWSLTSQELDILEIQIAFGPEYKIKENVSIYGGPFLHFIEGDYDATATVSGTPFGISADIEEDSIFGGYIGANIALFDKTSLNIEYQFTGGGQALALVMRWKF